MISVTAVALLSACAALPQVTRETVPVAPQQKSFVLFVLFVV